MYPSSIYTITPVLGTYVRHLYRTYFDRVCVTSMCPYTYSGPQGVRGRNSDNTLIKSTLGWAPSIPIRQGNQHSTFHIPFYTPLYWYCFVLYCTCTLPCIHSIQVQQLYRVSWFHSYFILICILYYIILSCTSILYYVCIAYGLWVVTHDTVNGNRSAGYLLLDQRSDREGEASCRY